jgi:hypothetical protein
MQITFLPNHAVAMIEVNQTSDSRYCTVQSLFQAQTRIVLAPSLLIQFVTVPFILLISLCEF